MLAPFERSSWVLVAALGDLISHVELAAVRSGHEPAAPPLRQRAGVVCHIRRSREKSVPRPIDVHRAITRPGTPSVAGPSWH
jgi:hypothetical protein